MGYDPELDYELPVIDDTFAFSNSISVDNRYIDRCHFITDEQIEEINKEIGDLIVVPRECGGGGDGIDIVIDICVGLISAGLFEAVKYGLIKLYYLFRKKFKEDKIDANEMVFRFFDSENNASFNLSVRFDGSKKELNSTIDKAKKIIDVLSEGKKKGK
jgi:hypothetical protein